MSKRAKKKSALVTQAEKMFPQQSLVVSSPQEYRQEYPSELRTVQSVTTYSACEAPITNLPKDL
jgi:hypothetical protein